MTNTFKLEDLKKSMEEYDARFANRERVGVIANAYTGKIEVRAHDEMSGKAVKGDFGVNRAFRRHGYDYSPEWAIEGLAILNAEAERIRGLARERGEERKAVRVGILALIALVALIIAIGTHSDVFDDTATTRAESPVETISSDKVYSILAQVVDVYPTQDGEQWVTVFQVSSGIQVAYGLPDGDSCVGDFYILTLIENDTDTFTDDSLINLRFCRPDLFPSYL